MSNGQPKEEVSEMPFAKVEQFDHLEEQKKSYRRFNDKMDDLDQSDFWDYEKVTKQILNNPIKCVKYNYSLDADIQDFLQFESLITISEDGLQLRLINKKPTEDAIHKLEADPYKIKKEQEAYKKH